MINYSFIIPHHNGPELLNRLLDSIPQREDIEIIVVDDNSDEDKKPVVSRSDVQVIYISAHESKGAGRARNIGMSKAIGKWLIFADSDDHYVDNAISTFDKYKDSDAEIVFWGSIMINSDGTIEHKENYLDTIMDDYNKSRRTLNDLHRMAMRSSFPWNKMIRRSFVMEIGARFEEVPIHNDAWFSRYIGSKVSQIEFTKEKIYCYYRYSNNTTNKKRPIGHYYSMVKTIKKINKLFIENNLIEDAVYPCFNPKHVVRDFGYLTLLKLYLYELLYDYNSINIIISKIKKKISKSVSL